MGSKREASGQEPVSGKEGEGTATQPFDAGNQEGEYDWLVCTALSFVCCPLLVLSSKLEHSAWRQHSHRSIAIA